MLSDFYVCFLIWVLIVNTMYPDQTAPKGRQQINFSKKSFRNTIRVSNSLDPDQDQHFVGPDLDPNCLPRLSVGDKSSRVK